MASRGSSVGTRIDPEKVEVICQTPTKGEQRYPFSCVFEKEDNDTLHDIVGRPLVESAIKGYNGTLLAYGQTGSGKTYTIGEISKLGTPHEGVAHRMIRSLFDEVRMDMMHHYDVTLQFVQIHVENIYDLLGEGEVAKGTATKLRLREDKATGVFIQGAVQEATSTAEETLELLQKASSRLTFASTNMNLHSSRSHAVCQLFVTKTPLKTPGSAKTPNSVGSKWPSMRTLDGQLAADGKPAGEGPNGGGPPNGPPNLKMWRKRSVEIISNLIENAAFSHNVTKGRISLVDLAGSEDVGRSGATGMTLAEAKKINTSLLALGNVIHALTEGTKGHVPFRNSALTMLLQASFGGYAHT